ncbi:MAG: O-antigen ligase family protein [Chlamydiota bacterium]
MIKVIQRYPQLLLLFFLVLPFQKRLNHFLRGASRALIPTDLTIPAGFSHHLYFFATDVCIIAAALLLLSKFRISLRTFFWDGPSKYLAAFLVIAWISATLSSTSHYLIHYLVILKFFVAVLFFNILKIAFEKIDFKKWFLSFCWIVLCFALIESALAISQYFLQHKVGLGWMGETPIHYQGFSNPLGYRWLPDALFPVQTARIILLRASGTMGHANDLGCLLSFSIIITSFLYMREESRKRQIGLQMALPVLLFALCTTFSRSAILFLVCTTLLFLAYQWRSPNRSRLIRLVATFAVTGAVCLTLFYPPFFCRGGIVNYNEITRGADKERILYQDVALQMVRSNPFLGVGFNNFQFALPQYCPEGKARPLSSQVHNIYLLIASETGLIGLSAFLLFLFSVFKKSLKKRWSPESKVLFCCLLLLLLAGTSDKYILMNLKMRLLFLSLCCFFYVSFDMKEREVDPALE